MSLRPPAGLDALAWNADGLVPVVVQEVASGSVLMLAWVDREALSRTVERGEGWFWSRSRRRLWRKGETSGHTFAVAEVAVDCDGDAVLYRVDAKGPACHTGARSCFEEAAADAVVAPPVRAPGPGEPIGEEGGESSSAETPPIVADVPPQRLGEGVDAAVPRLELGWLWDVLRERAAADPAASYTARLLAAGIDRVARKVGEEATEVVIAALRAAPASPATADARFRPPGGGVPTSSTTAGAGMAPSVTESAPSAASPLTAEAADLLYHLLVLLLAAGVPPEEVAAELRRRHARAATPASPKPESGSSDPSPSTAPTAEDRP